MQKVRSAAADWLTIITSSITIFSLLSPKSLVAENDFKELPEAAISDVNILTAFIVSFAACWFFYEVSIRAARYFLKQENRVTSELGVYTFCSVISMLLYMYSQFMFQYRVFEQGYAMVIVIPAVVWILNLAGMIVRWVNKQGS
ncbi:hypothetical protein ACEWBT_24235 [Vibrio parahaemolyticus]|uniref:hypothetical protein n=1 Tax=Vibrio parahaemolyticus TaxID=670 RepID=UPI0012FA4786|nr:hypothetical protein [Vibrio parahaemolyticus]EKQ5902657.1 hypothetical protein [Vibrio parahaemolyticus]ELA8137827.1 hypothetical protein [Vibrio parahaemolyticus]MCD1413641.1 hypothetical protein [Vibrio parahaemolyticus]MDF4476257.1 hypothetical protein [Vibrio parahaemolyticus]MDF4480772.1 hypothetical protein [Vibrio parahaemolyticus]